MSGLSGYPASSQRRLDFCETWTAWMRGESVPAGPNNICDRDAQGQFLHGGFEGEKAKPPKCTEIQTASEKAGAGSGYDCIVQCIVPCAGPVSVMGLGSNEILSAGHLHSPWSVSKRGGGNEERRESGNPPLGVTEDG